MEEKTTNENMNSIKYPNYILKHPNGKVEAIYILLDPSLFTNKEREFIKNPEIDYITVLYLVDFKHQKEEFEGKNIYHYFRKDVIKDLKKIRRKKPKEIREEINQIIKNLKELQIELQQLDRKYYRRELSRQTQKNINLILEKKKFVNDTTKLVKRFSKNRITKTFFYQTILDLLYQTSLGVIYDRKDEYQKVSIELMREIIAKCTFLTYSESMTIFETTKQLIFSIEIGNTKKCKKSFKNDNFRLH